MEIPFDIVTGILSIIVVVQGFFIVGIKNQLCRHEVDIFELRHKTRTLLREIRHLEPKIEDCILEEGWLHDELRDLKKHYIAHLDKQVGAFIYYSNNYDGPLAINSMIRGVRKWNVRK
jgi:hypothetical protein